jgi:hypothetical protein
MLLALALLNRAPAGEERRLGLAHLYAAGVVTLMLATLLTEYSYPNDRHSALFYQVMAAVLPFTLVSVARASRLRWAATIAAGFYMLLACLMVWILPLFPASPKLGPINMPLDHMVPPLFPLLLIIPTLAIDAILQRREGKRAGWLDAVAIGAAFLALFFVVHWLFAEFQLSPASRNWFFASDRQWDYASSPNEWRYKFWKVEENPVTAKALGLALLWAIGSARLGLWRGQAMARVQR